MNDFSTFGQRLRTVRKLKKMTLEDMAQLCGTSKQVLSRYENGQRTPKVTTAQKYAELLGVPLAYFLGEAEMPSESATGREEVYTMSIIGRGGAQQTYHLTPNEADKLLLLLEVLEPQFPRIQLD